MYPVHFNLAVIFAPMPTSNFLFIQKENTFKLKASFIIWGREAQRTEQGLGRQRTASEVVKYSLLIGLETNFPSLVNVP